jgi:excisionase family DNA binding protein
MSAAPKLAAVPICQPRLEPGDILTPEELAQRLKVRVRWIYEAVHGSNPLPCLRCGRYLRFSWPDVVAWMRGKVS